MGFDDGGIGFEVEVPDPFQKHGAGDHPPRVAHQDLQHGELLGVQLDQDVKLALERGEEDLARFAIRRLIAHRRQAEGLDEAIRAHREEREQLAAKLDEQEIELEALRDRVRQALARERVAERDARDPEACAATVKDEEVEIELLRRRGTAQEGRA